MSAEREAHDLDPEDELALRIGRVARAHVHVDNGLRSVHQTLSAPGLAAYLVGQIKSSNVLVQECRTMLAKADVSEDVRTAGDAALLAAAAANTTRNKVVHDMWMRDLDGEEQDGPPRWMRFRAAKGQLNLAALDPPDDLVFLETALVEVRRAHIRVNALYWALWEVLPFFSGLQGQGGGPPGGRLSDWIAVMNDRFELVANGGFRPLHP
jgi:hypothetical protein